MSSNNNDWRTELALNAAYRMDESLRMIDISLQELDDIELWKRPNSSSNSVGNLMVHLCGNIRQYAISSLGQHPDKRERDSEFSISGGLSKSEVSVMLKETVSQAKAVISSATEEELLRYRDVQGFNMSGIGIVMHVVEHLSYHTGQIAYWVKLLKDQDLGFYDGFDLNIKNE